MSTALATTTDVATMEADGLGQQLLARRDDFARSFGDALQAEKFLQDAYAAINANPKLRECTPESLIGALYLGAQLGLPIGGPLAQFHLTIRKVYNPAYGGKVQTVVPIVGYAGLIRLAMNSGEYDTIGGIVVRANDEFETPWADETGKHFKHRPAEKDRGDIIGVVGYATVRGAQRSELEWVSLERITRDHMPANPDARSPWSSHFEQMCQKTGARMVSKYTTKTAAAERFALAVRADGGIVTLNAAGALEVDHEPQALEDWESLIKATDDKADLEALWKRMGVQEPEPIIEQFTPQMLAHAATLTKDSRPAKDKPSPAEVEAAAVGQASAQPTEPERDPAEPNPEEYAALDAQRAGAGS